MENVKNNNNTQKGAKNHKLNYRPIARQYAASKKDGR